MLQVGGSIGLFSLITMFSFLLLAPFALLFEGAKFTPAAMHSLGISNPADVIQKASIAAFMFHAYQQVSYMILARVTPVTHSIGNCVKRCVHSLALLFFVTHVTLPCDAGDALHRQLRQAVRSLSGAVVPTVRCAAWPSSWLLNMSSWLEIM